MRRLLLLGLCVLIGAGSCFVLPVHAQALTKRIDNLPMYGQPAIPRSEEMRLLDERFIREAVAGLGSREQASEAWWNEAEAFVADGNYDFAMRRYNQAWLLNPSSFKPFWGFARVLLENKQVEPSIEQFDRALSLVNDKYQEPALLTDAANANVALARSRSDPEERRAIYLKADSMYDKALALDSEYGNAYKRYAMSRYYQGDYAFAWTMVREATKRRTVQIPPAFIEALRRAMPEPVK